MPEDRVESKSAPAPDAADAAAADAIADALHEASSMQAPAAALYEDVAALGEDQPESAPDKSAPKGGIHWRGVLADLELRARLVAFGMLAISTVAMVFTQLGFVPLGEIRLFTLLIPVAVGAFFYGPAYGAGLGVIGGTAAMLHAIFLPMDYYEKFFGTPMHSIVLFALTGLLAGFAFYQVEKRFGDDANLALPAHGLACLIVSWFCSTFFQVGAYLIQIMLSLELPPELLNVISGYRLILFQILVDALILFFAIAGAKAFSDMRRARSGQEATLRQTFQTWLSMVFAVAFMLVAAIFYTGSTFSCLEAANTAMTDHLRYVEGQLNERERWISHLDQTGDLRHEAYEAALHDSMTSIANDLPLWESGITVVAEDGQIISTNEDAFLGRSFEDVIASGVEGGYSEAVFDTDKPLEFYLGSGTDIGYLKASQINYVRVAQQGKYQIAAILPGEEVFRDRGTTMVGITGIFAVLLGLVYALSMGLLDNVVVQGFDRTNEALGHITEGDLDRVVDVHTSSEFTSLSEGINSTVGALKESIAEASARIDRELATAKAIQSSAIPQTFPPFPEIDRFDIFASMNAAKEVGGDFYDFFLIDDTHLGFVMADVSGKGIPASLFMMSAKTEIESCMQAGMGLVEAISTANYRLCQGNEAGMFVTVFAAILDYSTGELECLNAGHNPPLLRHNGSWQWLREKSGMFLGAFDELRFTSYKMQIEPGDALLLYTDGVTEAMNPEEKLYGEDRLEAFLAKHADLRPRRLIEAVQRDLTHYADGADQADDITMLSIEYGVAPEVSASILVPAKLEFFEKAMGFVHSELAKRVCPVNIQNQVDVCMEELFVNVVKYAYPDPDVCGNIRVAYTYKADPNRIIVEISDEGTPFNPLKVLEEGRLEDGTEVAGTGIFLTAQIADDMGYEYRDDCNVVSFTKKW